METLRNSEDCIKQCVMYRNFMSIAKKCKFDELQKRLSYLSESELKRFVECKGYNIISYSFHNSCADILTFVIKTIPDSIIRPVIEFAFKIYIGGQSNYLTLSKITNKEIIVKKNIERINTLFNFNRSLYIELVDIVKKDRTLGISEDIIKELDLEH